MHSGIWFGEDFLLFLPDSDVSDANHTKFLFYSLINVCMTSDMFN